MSAAATMDTIPAPPPDVEPALYGMRNGRASDHSYVIESWLTCTLHSSRARGMRPSLYKYEAKASFRAVLARPSVTLRVAHVPDDTDAILGWAIYEIDPENAFRLPVVFFVYVRKPMWGNGVARDLLSKILPIDRVEYAFESPQGSRLPIPATWDFNPTRLYR